MAWHRELATEPATSYEGKTRMQRGNMDLRWASEADSWLWELAGIYPSIFYGRLPASAAEDGEEEEKFGQRSLLGQQ